MLPEEFTHRADSQFQDLWLNNYAFVFKSGTPEIQRVSTKKSYRRTGGGNRKVSPGTQGRQVPFHNKKGQAQNMNIASHSEIREPMDPNTEDIVQSKSNADELGERNEPLVIATRIDDPKPTKVFVTNVPYDIDEASLTSEFGKHGMRVTKSTLYRAQGRHRGTGCVVVHPEDYSQALELNKKIHVHNRLLGVEPFRPKERSGRPPPPTRVYDGGEALISVSVTLVEWYVVQLLRTVRSQGLV
ncbi:hypothetical protein B0H13DRAFT_1881986 [Mycena leptocephala]|nr:hypothetical protein B0H13DRAFT_1881986 [Mycena leptocephala]